MLTEITALGGLAGLILSVALLAWQTRAVAEQTKISNNIAGASVLGESRDRLREIYQVFADHPALRPYFYGRRSCPRHGHRRARVITIAEMFADTLESGLFAYNLVSSSSYLENWSSYSRYMLTSSPALRELVRRYPHWWPKLHDLLPRVQPA
jgi:hypothetical protein